MNFAEKMTAKNEALNFAYELLEARCNSTFKLVEIYEEAGKTEIAEAVRREAGALLEIMSALAETINLQIKLAEEFQAI